MKSFVCSWRIFSMWWTKRYKKNLLTKLNRLFIDIEVQSIKRFDSFAKIKIDKQNRVIFSSPKNKILYKNPVFAKCLCETVFFLFGFFLRMTKLNSERKTNENNQWNYIYCTNFKVNDEQPAVSVEYIQLECYARWIFWYIIDI